MGGGGRHWWNSLENVRAVGVGPSILLSGSSLFAFDPIWGVNIAACPHLHCPVSSPIFVECFYFFFCLKNVDFSCIYRAISEWVPGPPDWCVQSNALWPTTTSWFPTFWPFFFFFFYEFLLIYFLSQKLSVPLLS